MPFLLALRVPVSGILIRIYDCIILVCLEQLFKLNYNKKYEQEQAIQLIVLVLPNSRIMAVHLPQFHFPTSTHFPRFPQ